MAALAAAYGIQLDGRQMALLCQKVENNVVGGSCWPLHCAVDRLNPDATQVMPSCNFVASSGIQALAICTSTSCCHPVSPHFALLGSMQVHLAE